MMTLITTIITLKALLQKTILQFLNFLQRESPLNTIKFVQADLTVTIATAVCNVVLL